ncbi:MAG: YajQ family cyclic di-GMP-binding protein [Pseudomonadales bacterium]|jgi:cyclic-di-GMP-binding protein|uniref:YajQ family cyclic di-GMP-binding protein n=1 Tax=unclassified Ketobacter TaxID=2639109 RepID=UPI000C8FD7F4|nr:MULTISPECIES: YajQ family cyclic di-GMP-binding protein [unclassified Ketobacter]MAA58829.1 YajQ family cyclic di-GMP-binding protein [Pseudomonadales bacterium]MEC8810141.1 YajQ family cyclic di-GMP-binding protein [Pseudomonadota bacterium]TNC90010.1 MAG: YajQ family cyclic di-GMP-binding protein [Alcanivorax sp.]HAG95074.1 YajQ family cyclic di-GMP-binding protein [Gammaproteobacteria bacterium]MAQ26862.1 YajQ family cyclic di-GMP-binding protein [Pseudomonadales bacterium]|tara:strand:- start:1164 stop:1646 length:483 start_codon:yes stop_codon:yes gene_type:complete
MPTFDIVSELNMHEVDNAVDQAKREVTNRFDFKGTKCAFEQDKDVITLVGDADFHLRQLLDILENKLIKRGIDIGCVDAAEPEVNLAEARQKITLRQGLNSEQAKKLVKLIKDSKMKVQASIQGDKVRVSGKKRDDLQQVIALLRETKFEMPLQYDNFRD